MYIYVGEGKWTLMVRLSKKILSFDLQVPELAFAAEYYFKTGVEGKRFRPTVRRSNRANTQY